MYVELWVVQGEVEVDRCTGGVPNVKGLFQPRRDLVFLVGI